MFGSHGALVDGFGEVFRELIYGRVFGADLVLKYAYLGVENVCFPCNCHQNQYVGEISYGLTFSSILGSILAPFWRLWAAIWRHLGCPGGYWKVGDIWRAFRGYLGVAQENRRGPGGG